MPARSPRPLHRSLHRLCGLLLTLPVLLWMGTGVLFHVKHRYAEAYEPLAVPLPPGTPSAWTEARRAPAELLAAGLLDAAGPLVLQRHPSGRPVLLGLHAGAGRAVDAGTGAVLPLADAATARAWALAAVAASAHAARYGTLAAALPEETQHASALLGRELPAYAFEFSGGKRVTVDRVTGEVAQTGALNDFIDASYRVHYLQWTPWRPLNLLLLALAVPGMLLLAGSGLWLARGRR
ncbi:hypothetical protein FGE12_29670 [Aggregicoccus sp. 17bor-14]|uniref:PepSY domain-containing protein n=1 Tax=Myxococcaceae TaxID=31 RepID=UPI00129D13F5|nr:MULTISPECIES: PepSY domain-containing protein [Myxococcaceae]MBF5046624.1 PepSY domain-containing protein [Simulacricoccus sp. 17bor-14]MRI92334.1 hypothetical protein [Aggregicoccus sp. 17bor-14]